MISTLTNYWKHFPPKASVENSSAQWAIFFKSSVLHPMGTHDIKWMLQINMQTWFLKTDIVIVEQDM